MTSEARLSQLTKRVKALEQAPGTKNSPLEKRLKALERAEAQQPARRARRLAGRVLRKLGLRR